MPFAMSTWLKICFHCEVAKVNWGVCWWSVQGLSYASNLWQYFCWMRAHYKLPHVHICPKSIILFSIACCRQFVNLEMKLVWQFHKKKLSGQESTKFPFWSAMFFFSLVRFWSAMFFAHRIYLKKISRLWLKLE